ncbi:MAG: invasion associated locus B family protein [Pseudomonadota bacterium]
MAFRWKSTSPFSGFVALGLLAAGLAPAVAQDAPAGNQQVSPWVKVCEAEPGDTGREICLVTQELRGENGNFAASAAIRTHPETDQKPAIIVGLPLGMLLQPGVRYQVDEGQQAALPFGICLPAGCFAEAEIDEGVVGSLKRGNELRILAISGRGQTLSFRMSLAGFTATFDGDPIDPEVLAESQRQLEEALRQRAEQARQRRQQQGGGQAPATTE